MFRKTIIILTFTIITASIACTQKEVDPIQERIKTTLSELRGNAPETIIDLDKAAEVTLTPAFTLSDEHLEDSGLFFADISSVHFADETYYVVDAKQHTIFKFNQQFEHIGNIGQYGRGPVDFQQPSGIFKHNNHYFIADNGNMRIQILDENLNMLTAIQDITFATFNPQLSVSKNYIGVINHNPASKYSLMIFTHDDGDDFDHEYNTFELFKPKILSAGEVPMSLNLALFGMNRKGIVASAYLTLPHIFVYDINLDLTHFITITGLGAIDDYGNYKIFSESTTENHPMTRNRISSLLIDDNNNLFFTSRAENIVHHVTHKSGQYKNPAKLKLEGLSQYPILLSFIVGDYLAIVDKKYANRIHFYDLYQP